MTWTKISSDVNGHTHTNKSTLDKLNESGGSLTFNGASVGGSGSTSPLQGKIWNVLGDSVTEGDYNITPNNQPPFVSVTTYHELIKPKYSMVVNKYGIGGTRITATGDNLGFCQRFGSMTDTADIITVFGGINDYTPAVTVPVGDMNSTDNSTMYGALKTLCSGLINKYPGKAIGFIIPFPFNEYKGLGTFKPYRQAIIDVCEYYSIPYLDLYTKSNLNTNIPIVNSNFFKVVNDAGDKVHPNTEGHKVIARQIENFLKEIYNTY